MKHLIIFLLLSTSAFSQEKIDTAHIGRLKLIFRNDTLFNHYYSGEAARDVVKPDTLRAILLVTLGYRRQGIAHARMGFVVICEGKRPVYLDCKKRALKWPMVGWGWVEVDKSNKK